MQTKLARALVKLGVIRQGTVIEAYRSARGLSCVDDSYALTRYVVIGATATKEHVYFDVVDGREDRRKLRDDYVAQIDGMALKRVAAAHQLHESGDPIPRDEVKRRRGRRRLLMLPAYEGDERPAYEGDERPDEDEVLEEDSEIPMDATEPK